MSGSTAEAAPPHTIFDVSTKDFALSIQDPKLTVVASLRRSLSWIWDLRPVMLVLFNNNEESTLVMEH